MWVQRTRHGGLHQACVNHRFTGDVPMAPGLLQPELHPSKSICISPNPQDLGM